jgi:superfamily II DNA or RNA helicase
MRRNIPKADVVLIDEAHRWFDFYGKWMLGEEWRQKPFVGLSATPWTKGLGQYYDDLIIAATTQDMIDRGTLSDFKVYAPGHVDLKGVRTVAGDYHEGDLSKAVDQPKLVGDTVSTWIERAGGRPTLVFAVDRLHAKHLELQFNSAGVPTDYVDAFTDRNEREAVRARFHRGETKVVCNVGVLTTGVDWDVRCIVLARPTKSEMLFVQMIGRGLRTAEGKDHCLVLDHSDTHLRLGFVTDIHHEHLNDGKTPVGTDKVMTLPKKCPQCSYLKPPKCAVCPACGFKSQPVNKTEHGAGELAELKREKKPQASLFEKQIFLSGLKWIAMTKGYKPGWASNQFREKFKVWPDRSIEHTRATSPSPEVLNWVKSRQIAYAKSKRRLEHDNAVA